MSSSITGTQIENYQINTDMYEGPLDLLLDLIERAQLDITRLALAQVTDQYLTYMRSLTEKDAAEVSAFLVIAAKLIQIKSEALLPRPPVREAEEEDPGEALAQQLIIYRRFKRAAGWLNARELAGLRCYLHMAPLPKNNIKLDLTGITFSDFLAAARSVYADEAPLSPLSRIIPLSKITIRAKINFILQNLKRENRHSFFRLLGDHYSRIDVVVLFLAVLELIKRQIIEASQANVFDDITLEPIVDIIPFEEFDLEFDD
jgi:segregation and condensation protein A